MRFVFCVCFFILLFFSVFSQKKVLVHGTLLDSLSSNKIEGAVIKFYNVDNKIVSYVVFNENSVYAYLSEECKLSFAEFTHSDYKTKRISISIKKGVINFGVVKVVKNEFFLREVKITSSNREVVLIKNKDTLVADFSKEYFKPYVMTESALDLIPGLKRMGSKIFFNGEEINDVNVGGELFIFGKDFLMQNLPAYVISKVQIINKEGLVGNRKQLNIVLKDGFKYGYIYDSIISKSIGSEKWGAITIGKIDSLFQVGLRAQLNDINQLSNAWDLRSISRINNIQGLNSMKSLELSLLYSLNEKTKFSFSYLFEDQFSKNDQHNSIFNLNSILNNISELNSSTYLNRKRNQAVIEVKKKIDSLTSFSSNLTGLFSVNNFNNQSMYNNTDYSTDYYNNRLSRENKLDFTFLLDKLSKIDKKQFYSIVIKGGMSFMTGKDSLSVVNFRDSAVIRDVNNFYLNLQGRLVFFKNKLFNFSFFTQNNFSNYSLINDFFSSEQGHLNLFSNSTGLKSLMSRKKISVIFDLSIANNALFVDNHKFYGISGFLSNIDISYSFNSSKKLYINFNNNYSMPSTKQLTGISTSVDDQGLYVLANPALKPEKKYNISIKYDYKNMLNLELGNSNVLGKIDSYITNNQNGVPNLMFINVGKSRYFYVVADFNKQYLKGKLYLSSIVKFDYSFSHYLSDSKVSSDNRISMNFNSSVLYFIDANIKVNYIVDLYKSKFFNNNDYQMPTQVLHKLSSEINIFKFWQLTCEANLMKSKGDIMSQNVSSQIINAVVVKQILRSKLLKCFLKVNNVLDSKVDQFVSTNSSTIQYTKFNNMGRYFLFGINYKISNFKIKK